MQEKRFTKSIGMRAIKSGASDLTEGIVWSCDEQNETNDTNVIHQERNVE